MKPGCSTALVLPRSLGILVKQPGQDLVHYEAHAIVAPTRSQKNFPASWGSCPNNDTDGPQVMLVLDRRYSGETSFKLQFPEFAGA